MADIHTVWPMSNVGEWWLFVGMTTNIKHLFYRLHFLTDTIVVKKRIYHFYRKVDIVKGSDGRATILSRIIKKDFLSSQEKCRVFCLHIHFEYFCQDAFAE